MDSVIKAINLPIDRIPDEIKRNPLFDSLWKQAGESVISDLLFRLREDFQSRSRKAAEDICSLFYSCRLNECIKNGNNYDLCKKFGECKYHAIDEAIKIISRHFAEGEE